jgi:hypothetical protein
MYLGWLAGRGSAESAEVSPQLISNVLRFNSVIYARQMYLGGLAGRGSANSAEVSPQLISHVLRFNSVIYAR